MTFHFPCLWPNLIGSLFENDFELQIGAYIAILVNNFSNLHCWNCHAAWEGQLQFILLQRKCYLAYVDWLLWMLLRFDFKLNTFSTFPLIFVSGQLNTDKYLEFQGTAMASLIHMRKILSGRMQYFSTLEKAVSDCFNCGPSHIALDFKIKIWSSKAKIVQAMQVEVSKNKLS